MGDGTSIGRVRGLGSAHEGPHHWLLQRYTAIGNLLLGSWFVSSLLMLPDLAYGTLMGWLSGSVPGTLLILLVISTFWHARLGLQVLIEDYVHDEGLKFGAMAALNLVTWGAGALAALCALKAALGVA